MNAIELLALASSISLLAGWRLYLVTLVTGLAMKWGFVALPDQLRALDVLASNWVIGIAAVGTIAEFFSDKIAWVDSAWDAIHTWVRPLGGALLSLAIVDAGDPAFQIGSFLLGGGAAFLAHAGKAGARVMINASPEPVSNVIVSTGEDVATGGLMALAIANPIAAALIALALVLTSLWLVMAARRFIRRIVEPRPR
ncbi:MAG TPA: DUF4126 domain-containing protein [Sphingomicrobium sp.]|nr:DUF4126 domain-containing protein [Sphingomicrobium sp.]